MPVMFATKSFRYATRRLQADDSFEPTEKYGKLLSAIGKARYATEDEIAKLAGDAAKVEKREAAKEARAEAKAEQAKAAADALAQVDDVSFFQFKALATKVLGDETPNSKAEIIEALQKRAGATS